MNANGLKCIFLILMFLDHIGVLLPVELAAIFKIASRCVCAGFAFLIVESFKYTSNRIKFLARLYFAATIMLVGNIILMLLFRSQRILVVNNIFLTFSFSVTLLIFLEQIREYPKKQVSDFCMCTGIGFAAFSITLVGICFGEGGLLVLPFVLITFYCKKICYRFLGYSVLSIVLFIISYPHMTDLTSFAAHSNFLFVSVIPFLFLYSGERGGKNNFTKYFFYVFYPLHIWIIAAVQFYLREKSL